MLDLEETASQILDDIDTWAAKHYDDGERDHLGASLIGDECMRKSWYTFRWISREIFTGRMQRLFQRGHLEEHRFIEYLYNIGFEIRTVDPETLKQWRINHVRGHYGGSLDSIGYAPHYFPEPVLLEFKTYHSKSFVNLKRQGFVKFRPKHYAQCCAYGRFMQIRYVLYMAVNKNDDDLHVELVELNWEFGAELEKKAEHIIDSPVPPKRISDDPTYFNCKYCFARPICHYGEPINRNCRSCANAMPANEGQWYCKVYRDIIPHDFIRVGCPQHYTPIV